MPSVRSHVVLLRRIFCFLRLYCHLSITSCSFIVYVVFFDGIGMSSFVCCAYHLHNVLWHIACPLLIKCWAMLIYCCCSSVQEVFWVPGLELSSCLYVYVYIYIYIYTGCPRRIVPDFGRVFLMLKYTDITQNTYVQSWTFTEIMAREVWNFDSYSTLIDYQIHIKTGRNMWFL